jgi:hypothetical protein
MFITSIYDYLPMLRQNKSIQGELKRQSVNSLPPLLAMIIPPIAVHSLYGFSLADGGRKKTTTFLRYYRCWKRSAAWLGWLSPLHYRIKMFFWYLNNSFFLTSQQMLKSPWQLDRSVRRPLDRILRRRDRLISRKKYECTNSVSASLGKAACAQSCVLTHRIWIQISCCLWHKHTNRTSDASTFKSNNGYSSRLYAYYLCQPFVAMDSWVIIECSVGGNLPLRCKKHVNHHVKVLCDKIHWLLLANTRQTCHQSLMFRLIIQCERPKI